MSAKASVGHEVQVESAEVRDGLAEALELDLVGPGRGHPLADERLRGWERPGSWYLTGFLIPSGTPPEKSADPDEDEDVEEVSEDLGAPEESSEDPRAARKGHFPSSMGLSFLVSAETRAVAAMVRWGDYAITRIPDEDGKLVNAWQRTQREESVPIDLPGAQEDTVHPVPNSRGLQLHVVEKKIESGGLAGCRSVSIFLVNTRMPDDDSPDAAYAFQAEIEVSGEKPFVPRPDLRGAQAEDWDDHVADLHYADAPEYATGHAVSVTWEITGSECRVLRTVWMPRAEVPRTETTAMPLVELSIEMLGQLADGAAVKPALEAIVESYRGWIKGQESVLGGFPAERRNTAAELLRLAGVAAARIERGISLLSEDRDSLDAFRMANRAIALAMRKRRAIQGLADEAPRWRAFQLAFILLNLPGIADPRAADREIVDLLFFPTGGGKTEAYLGLAAFTMVLRRLRHPGDNGLAGAGVSVIMRYTLRLLTLDQLGRAASMVCALELERSTDPARYGNWPFEIGLWVGKAATPNAMGYKGDQRSDSARTRVNQFKKEPNSKPSPIPLETCPWCGKRFTPDSFSLLPNDDKPRELRITCADFECDFSHGGGLPIVAVDEPLYRRLPAFLIATVDKFASLPWVGESGVLLGGADRHDANGFYGGAEPGHGKRLSEPLPPPDLVIQDELHLISGPLGTMAGLYEAAIEALCVRQLEGRAVRPKIVASTATIRQAQEQVQALFARGLTQVFPPQGPSRHDSFFAHTVPPCESPARLYLGVAAQGRNPKVVFRRTWLTLMSAAERAYRDQGGHKNDSNPADPYMTVVGYFNALRELGGARRILEEEVRNTLTGYGKHTRVGEKQGLLSSRKAFSAVVELTSRVSTRDVAEARRRLELPFNSKEDRVDYAIATNMISVGLDIPRLGLMVVFGQPKTNAEYIQSTSRVGRDQHRPGLVVTVLNVHKPRDRSHYERFQHYHDTFYRSVEIASVTPFSARALDRGFAGAMVALARHMQPVLTPPRGAEQIVVQRPMIQDPLLAAFRDRVQRQAFASEAEREERLLSVQSRVSDLLDAWIKVCGDFLKDNVPFQYQKYETEKARPLLRDILEKGLEPAQKKFRVGRSLRDVEPDVNLFLKPLSGELVEDAE